MWKYSITLLVFFGGIILSVGVFSQSDSSVTSISTTAASEEKQANIDEQAKFRLDALTPPQAPFIKIEEKKEKATGQEKEESQKEETEEIIPAEKK